MPKVCSVVDVVGVVILDSSKTLATSAPNDALKFGAVYGTGRGLQGQTYALPTKSTPYKPLPLPEIAANIRELYACAVAHPHLTFLVTPVGCGLAGYAVGEIAELFTDPPDNLVFLNDWNKNV